jgi:hydrogenase expression/formation protein HypD
MNSRETEGLIEKIRSASRTTGPVRLMEVCGTHTVSLFRSGVRSVLPSSLRMISGPGCPVCVTSQGYIDAALEAAARPGVTVCTYGDMLRVPGRTGNLELHRARGAGVVVCYSARDALRYAETHGEEEIVFLSVGFETTAPGAALALLEAERLGIGNFSLLCGHKLVMPALNALLADGELPVDGFLLPGHVSVIIGSDIYRPLAAEKGKACAVAGFEPVQLLRGIAALVEQIAKREPRVDNVYAAAVSGAGNARALQCLDTVFEPADTVWRAMGTIPESGLELRDRYGSFDACRRHGLSIGADYDPPGCRCGEVIQGKLEPPECALFGGECTHENPIGPCMVSSEGTCAAWFRYASPGDGKGDGRGEGEEKKE